VEDHAAFLAAERKTSLQDVFGLGPIPNSPEGDREHLPEIPMEEQRKAVRTALAYVAQQVIVWERADVLVGGHCVGAL
jgi:hypothetical protein